MVSGARSRWRGEAIQHWDVYSCGFSLKSRAFSVFTNAGHLLGAPTKRLTVEAPGRPLHMEAGRASDPNRLLALLSHVYVELYRLPLRDK